MVQGLEGEAVRGIDVFTALSALGGVPPLLRTLKVFAADARSWVHLLRVSLATRRERWSATLSVPETRRRRAALGSRPNIRGVSRDLGWRRPLGGAILVIGFVCL